MLIRRINYSNDKQITAIKSQPLDGYVWVAFAQNTDGVCILEKQFKTEPAQSFFSLEKEVDKIVQMDLDATDIYLAYQDDELFGEKISLTNPITSTIEIPIPVGITEYPVDIQIDGSDIWYLTPGNATGENAKLLRFDTDGELQETVDLTKTGEEVLNATSFDIDADGEIWVVTNTSPATIVRVFGSPGSRDFTITEII